MFNLSISDTEGEIKCTLTEFAEDPKLSGEVDISEGTASLQEVLVGLEDNKRASIIIRKDFFYV